MNNSKACSHCKQIKSYDQFHRNKSRPTGRSDSCKQCRMKETAESRDRNRDSINAKNREYHQKNKDLRNAIRKKRFHSVPAEVRKAYRQKWYQDNKEKSVQKSREWRKNNKEQISAQHAARRARKLKTISDGWKATDVLARWGNVCNICGKEIDLNAPRKGPEKGWENGLHFDHVLPLAKGGTDTFDNIKPAHALCNLRKQ